MSEDNHNDDGDTSTGVVVKTRPKVKKPSMYKVLMLNDDYTPMEFVVHVLNSIFTKPGKRRRRSCCTSTAAASGFVVSIPMRSPKQR